MYSGYWKQLYKDDKYRMIYSYKSIIRLFTSLGNVTESCHILHDNISYDDNNSENQTTQAVVLQRIMACGQPN